MLILSRKVNESIVIDGKIIVKVLRIDRDTVKLGIQAPPELPVHRQEVYDMIQRNKAASGNAGSETFPKSPRARVTPPPGGAPPPGSSPLASPPPPASPSPSPSGSNGATG